MFWTIFLCFVFIWVLDIFPRYQNDLFTASGNMDLNSLSLSRRNAFLQMTATNVPEKGYHQPAYFTWPDHLPQMEWDLWDIISSILHGLSGVPKRE